MRKIIRHLRSKSEETRIRIVHLFVIVSGVVLVSLWLVSIGGVITSPENTAQVQLSDELKPLNALKDNFVDGYKSISTSSVLEIE